MASGTSFESHEFSGEEKIAVRGPSSVPVTVGTAGVVWAIAAGVINVANVKNARLSRTANIRFINPPPSDKT
jgi:hypothetical protein